MYALDEHNLATITLHVADLERSRTFYRELLGLHAVEGGDDALLMEGEESEDVRLVLRVRDEQSPPAHGQWLSVEVGGVAEVLDLYLLAVILGAKALLPRKHGDRWNTVVTDPDGHRISVWTPVPVEESGTVPGRSIAGDLARRSPRLEWDLAHRRGYNAMDERRRPERGRIDRDSNEEIPGASAGRGRESNATPWARPAWARS